jgi:hypothetical protein
MTDALRRIVLPGEPTPDPADHPAARYAVYALEELSQVAFAGLAEAVATYEAQGVAFPSSRVPSRHHDPNVRGLLRAVEQALDELTTDRSQIAATAASLGIRDRDVLDAMAADVVRLVQPKHVDINHGLPHAVRREHDHLVAIGRCLAVRALLDEVRERERPS